MIESLWARRSKSSEATTDGRLARSRVAMAGRAGQGRREVPPPAACVRAMLASRNLLVAIKDLDGRYLELNEAYARALGLDPQAARGRLDRDLLAPDVAGEMAQRERLAMRGVALKPGLESFADDSPTYLVERLPILDSTGGLVAVCLIAMESRPLTDVDTTIEKMPAGESNARSGPLGTVPAQLATCEMEALPPEVWLSASSASNQLEWDAALYRSLLSMFCQRYADFGERLAERHAAGRVEDLARDLARLVSGARSLGAIPLAGLAAELRATLERGEIGARTVRLERFRRALDATILVIECRIRATTEPFEWPAAGGDAGETLPSGSLAEQRLSPVA